MRTMSTTRRAGTTSRGRGRIRGGPVDKLFERAKSWRPPSDSGLAQASTPEGTVGADRVVVNVSTDDALGTDDLCGLVDRLARGEVSSEELWDAAMGRAEQANRVLNAVCTWVERSSAGRADGPFAGVPSAVKDNEDLAGYPTSWGSRAVPDRPAQVSTAFVEQFLQLGLAPIAKTTLPEFGFTASAESSRFGATVNPWDTGRSAGGSSGGSAALVAAGVVPVAHGNDGGGSLRIPAAACGLGCVKDSGHVLGVGSGSGCCAEVFGEDCRGGAVAQGGMASFPVVEHFDVFSDGESGTGASGESVAVVHLVLQRREE